MKTWNIKTLTLNIILWFADPINTFNCPYKTENEPIRISYHGNVHYNSIVDPFKATIGVGLGLPGLQPGVCLACQAQQRSRSLSKGFSICCDVLRMWIKGYFYKSKGHRSIGLGEKRMKSSWKPAQQWWTVKYSKISDNKGPGTGDFVWFNHTLFYAVSW